MLKSEKGVVLESNQADANSRSLWEFIIKPTNTKEG